MLDFGVSSTTSFDMDLYLDTHTVNLVQLSRYYMGAAWISQQCYVTLCAFVFCKIAVG